MAYEDGIHKQIEKTKNRLTNIDEAWYIKKNLINGTIGKHCSKQREDYSEKKKT